jgi:AraC family L-rhamnose operon transcriptional activator RhaR
MDGVQAPIEQPPMDAAHGRLHFTDGLQAYAGSYRHDGDSGLHSHGFVEIVVVTGGSGVHHAAAGRQPLHAGDVLLLRPGLWHGYEDCRALDIYNCCFSAELLQRELAWMREDALLGRLLWTGPRAEHRRGLLTFGLGAAALAQCREHLDALHALYRAPLRTHRGDVVGRLSLLLGALGRALDGRRQRGAPPAEPTHPLAVQAMRLLESRPAQPWTVPGLADELHVSPGYLARLFKAATGLPPMAYLAQHRIEVAADLLLHTDWPVGQIGRAVGWPDQNLFARRFRAHAGLSATTFRARFARSASVGLGHAESSVSR